MSADIVSRRTNPDRVRIGETEISVFKDRLQPGGWCVELVDDDGGCDVKMFAGRNVEARARQFR